MHEREQHRVCLVFSSEVRIIVCDAGVWKYRLYAPVSFVKAAAAVLYRFDRVNVNLIEELVDRRAKTPVVWEEVWGAELLVCLESRSPNRVFLSAESLPLLVSIREICV